MSRKYAGNPFEKQKVLDACKVALFLLGVSRDSYRDRVACPYREYRKYWLFGPWQKRSLEEALDIATDHWEYWPDWDYLSGEEEILLSIQKVATSVLGNQVWLIREEFDLLAPYYRRTKKAELA